MEFLFWLFNQTPESVISLLVLVAMALLFNLYLRFISSPDIGYSSSQIMTSSKEPEPRVAPSVFARWFQQRPTTEALNTRRTSSTIFSAPNSF